MLRRCYGYNTRVLDERKRWSSVTEESQKQPHATPISPPFVMSSLMGTHFSILKGLSLRLLFFGFFSTPKGNDLMVGHWRKWRGCSGEGGRRAYWVTQCHHGGEPGGYSGPFHEEHKRKRNGCRGVSCVLTAMQNGCIFNQINFCL